MPSGSWTRAPAFGERRLTPGCLLRLVTQKQLHGVIRDAIRTHMRVQKRTDATRCPFCGARRIVRAGRRKVLGGLRQLLRCNACLRRFSSLNRTGKHTEAAAILRTLILRCRGYTLDEIAMFLQRRHRVVRDKSTLSRWIREYAPPYLEILRDVPPSQGPLTRSWLFTHRRLNYLYQLHYGKLRFATPFGRLRAFLETIPATLDHRIFDRARHCAGMKVVRNPGLQHCKFSALNTEVLRAVTMAQSRRQRHRTVEDYLLNCDRNTIATEVPVYYHDRHLGWVAGHIDVLQINYGRVQILDYKPDAARENPAKVASQLTFYAIALAVQAGLHLPQIRCGYFDEQDLLLFEPRKPDREPVRTFADLRGAQAGQGPEQ